MRQIALKKGYTLNEYSLRKVTGGKLNKLKKNLIKLVITNMQTFIHEPDQT